MPQSNSDDLHIFQELSTNTKVKIDKFDITLYDIGPKEISCPLICFPPTTCDASIFYKVQLFLSSEGYRIISINYPSTYSANEFCDIFLKLLDELHLRAVHLLGSSLGGFLAQKVCELSSRVKSLIICNSYVDSSSFDSHISSKVIWMLPAVALRMTIDYPPLPDLADESLKMSMEVAKNHMYKMSQSQLASRLTMSSTSDKINVEELQHVDVTIIEVADVDAVYMRHYESVHRAYPEAKVASLDSGGHFPFLSRPEEFVAYMKVACFLPICISLPIVASYS